MIDRHASAADSSAPRTESPRLAMIVEDDDTIRNLIALLLEDARYFTISVPTVDGARRLLANVRPDLVVLDLYLRGELGTDLLEDMVHWRVPPPPTILVSASRDAGVAAKTYGIDFVAKPFDIDHLTERIDQSFRERRRPSRAG